MSFKSWLYKLAVAYIGKRNQEWEQKDLHYYLQKLDRLTYRNYDKAYLCYGADAEWQHFSSYEVLDNAIQKLAEYEDKEVILRRSRFMRYKTKPIMIEAIKWTGLNLEEIKEFVGESLEYDILDTAWEVGKGAPHILIRIKTLEGVMNASVGDYIIKGLRGEFYPCKPDVFEKKYEVIE